MSEFSFRLLLDVPRDLSDDDLNALYEATDADATFGSDNEGWSAEFDREADDLATAVFDAIEQLEGAPVGVHVRTLVSDAEALVGATEIAGRARISRQAVNFYADGERNRDLGPFPGPVATFASGQRIWRWGDVAPWIIRASKRVDISTADADTVAANAETTAAINDYLDLRRRAPHLSAGLRKKVLAALSRELTLTA